MPVLPATLPLVTPYVAMGLAAGVACWRQLHQQVQSISPAPPVSQESALVASSTAPSALRVAF